MGYVLVALYSLFALVAASNLLLLRRPKSTRASEDPANFCVLIPARNEEQNLPLLLEPLLSDLSRPRPKVYVYDDESTDGTAAVAASFGASVIKGSPLPAGWIGKNRACHELAKVALEDCGAEWFLFLDADTRPKPGFTGAIEDLIATVGHRKPVISAFPQVLPGRGIEPLFLGWVGWALLCTTSYGFVARTGIGHPKFTNGQFGLWRASTYSDVWPHERVKGRIMEDVLIGRLLARERIPLEIVNVSDHLSVRMYENWRETLDGMSKNAFEAGGSVPGALGIAALMLLVGWGWVFAASLLPWALGLFTLSGIFVGMTVKAPLWPSLLSPLVLTIGAYTTIRSTFWRLTGRTQWKGRVYP